MEIYTEMILHLIGSKTRFYMNSTTKIQIDMLYNGSCNI